MNSFYSLLLPILGGCLFHSSTHAEPANLSLIKKTIIRYHDSGAYQQELTHTIHQAHAYMLKEITINQHRLHPKQLALVLDIDETSLSNYPKLVKRDFSGDYRQIHQEILAADSPAIKPMLALYRDALKHHVRVYFITGRMPSEAKATKLNLKRAGYTQWSGIYFRPKHYHQASIVPFKAHTRALISQKGNTIVASIGDQYSDIKGGYAQKGFKLPNPYYFIS